MYKRDYVVGYIIHTTTLKSFGADEKSVTDSGRT
jgi:hypothetical protein